MCTFSYSESLPLLLLLLSSLSCHCVKGRAFTALEALKTDQSPICFPAFSFHPLWLLFPLAAETVCVRWRFYPLFCVKGRLVIAGSSGLVSAASQPASHGHGHAAPHTCIASLVVSNLHHLQNRSLQCAHLVRCLVFVFAQLGPRAAAGRGHGTGRCLLHSATILRTHQCQWRFQCGQVQLVPSLPSFIMPLVLSATAPLVDPVAWISKDYARRAVSERLLDHCLWYVVCDGKLVWVLFCFRGFWYLEVGLLQRSVRWFWSAMASRCGTPRTCSRVVWTSRCLKREWTRPSKPARGLASFPWTWFLHPLLFARRWLPCSPWPSTTGKRCGNLTLSSSSSSLPSCLANICLSNNAGDMNCRCSCRS